MEEKLGNRHSAVPGFAC